MYLYSRVFFLISFQLCVSSKPTEVRLPLCPEEKRLPTIFADVGDNITFTVCVIHDGGLKLDKVRCLHRCYCRHCPLPKERFSSTVVPTDGGRKDYHDLTIGVDRIEEDFFGILLFSFFSDHRRLEINNITIQFVKKGFAFNTYTSLARLIRPRYGPVSPGESLYLICESSDYPLLSLSIIKKDSEEILHTNVVDAAMTYHVESAQCSHMGTYVCFYNNDTSQNATLDVLVNLCPPQLCYEENKTRRVFAALFDNVSFDFCVISRTRKYLHLDSVFRHGNREDKLPENRYETSLISTTSSTIVSRFDVNVTLRDVQENDFGKISITLCDTQGSKKYCLIYEMVLEVKEIELKIYRSEQQVPVDDHLYWGESLHLICETGGRPSSSLRIGKYYSKEILSAPDVDGDLVYHFERLQCSDMGTYVCFHKNDTSKNASVNVPVKFCPPQLCNVESSNITVYASLNDNVTVGICIVSLESPSLTSVFQNGNSTDELLKSRYEGSSISPMTHQRLYWKVNFVLGDLQEEDFGSISINIQSMIYVMVLAKIESKTLQEIEKDVDLPLIMYAVSACLIVVGLTLVGIFIYFKIRKRWSGTYAFHYQNELTERPPASSQQSDGYYSATRYENAFAEQLQELITSQETNGDGYIDPAPIYESCD